MEIITLSRDQYQSDLQEAARIGAMLALREHKADIEWVSKKEAMDMLKITDDRTFMKHRMLHKIIGKDKVKKVGAHKFFNKKHLI